MKRWVRPRLARLLGKRIRCTYVSCTDFQHGCTDQWNGGAR